MARTAQIPRSRGGFSGLILILLGAWGGLIPLVGPYFHYGFTPDRTWDLTQGRLDLSVIPGAAVLLAGLLIMLTRSRGFGGFWAFVAALAGFWFIAGAAVIQLFPASLSASVAIGTPIDSTPHRAILTSLGLYAGVGSLILFFAALALGRFSIAPAREHARVAGELADSGAVGLAGTGAGSYDSYQSAQPAQAPYSPGQDVFGQSPDPFGQTQDRYGQSQNTLPHSPASFPPAGEQYPTSPKPYQGGQDPYVGSQDPFPGSHDPYQQGQTQ